MIVPRRSTLSLRHRLALLAALALAAIAPMAAQVPLQYTFDYGTGIGTDMSGATVLRGDSLSNDDVTTGVQPIGFTFVYEGAAYTEFSANANGLLRLGDTAIDGQWTNALTSTANYPLIANYWDDLYLDVDPVFADGGAGGIFAKVTGAVGSRVLTIEWRARRYNLATDPGEVPYTFQTRLYEGSNAIEFYYDSMSTRFSTSGSIGLALDDGHFISVTPGYGSPLGAPTVSTTIANDTIELQGEIARLPHGTLYRFTPVIMAVFTSNSSPIENGSALFTLMNSCVGESSVTVPVTVTNVGMFDLTISSFDLFAVDSTDTQGQMQLVRDAFGRVVPTTDYIVTDVPGTAPMGANLPSIFPDTVAAGASRTYYVTFVSQIPGRRLARAFLQTNANTFSGADTSAPPALRQGLLVVDLVGQGIGSALARNLDGARLRTVVFPETRVGDTVVRTFDVVNAGACDLRISRRRLRIFSGDVNEYRMLSIFPNVPVDNARDDYMIAPGDTGRITVAFMPVRSGTRMATIFFQSNDSTLGIPGVTERGSWYLDLHGKGSASLDARPLVLRPVVIGGFTNGMALIENNSIAAVDIARIYFTGGDSIEFAQDAIAGWPTLPSRILSGDVLRLGVRLTPIAGSAAGIRRTTLVIVTTTGDTLRIPVRGEAGTRQLLVTPTSLFENTTLAVGQAARRTVTIMNTGTLPVRLTGVTIVGPDSLEYRLGLLPRMDLDPGQMEFLEVTFAPTTAGQLSAEIHIASNAGPEQVVTLGGIATRIRRGGDDDPGVVAAPGAGAMREARETPTLR
jgi:hypothetical protein